jgi:MFS family permease
MNRSSAGLHAGGRDFLLLWSAYAISSLGSYVTLVALPLVAALTLDAGPEQMGLLAAAETAPFLLAGLFAGVGVDRWPRRPVLIGADLGRAATLLTVPVAAGLDLLDLRLLYGVALVTGTLTTFFDVAHASFVPVLVRSDALVAANSRLHGTGATAQVAGPSVAGLLVGLVTAPFAVLVDAASFLISAALLLRVRVREPKREQVGERLDLRLEIGEGVRAVLGDRTLRAVAACSATTSLAGFTFLAVYILFMARELGLSSTGIGLVLSTGGVGALIGAALAGPAARRFGQGTAMIGAQVLFGVTGLAVPLAVLAPRVALPLVVASEFLQWLTYTVYVVNAVSLRQAVTPDRLQGRVNATFRFLAGGAQPLGSLLGGLLGGLIGLPLTLIVAELGMLTGFLWLFFSPVRRSAEDRQVEAAPPVLV